MKEINMSLSDELREIKLKYMPNDIEYTVCSKCKNSSAFGTCLKCEKCGRHFKHGILVEEVKGEKE